jgi:hypothetical protein
MAIVPMQITAREKRMQDAAGIEMPMPVANAM